MKINNQLLAVVNARLEDLFFEVGVLGRLEEYPTKEELAVYFAQEFEPEIDYDDEGEPCGQTISNAERVQKALKRALEEIGVADMSELLTFLSKKLKQPLNSLDDVKTVVEQLKEDLTNVLQLDRVSESLVKFGAQQNTLDDFEQIKNSNLIRLFGLLGVEVKEVEND